MVDNNKPNACSTPKLINIKCRPLIGDAKNESIQSPVTVNSDSDLQSDDDYRHSDTCLESFEETDDVTKEEGRSTTVNTDFGNCLSPIIMALIGILLAIAFLLFYVGADEENHKKDPSFQDLETISSEFPLQVQDFWLSLDVALNDTKRLNQPKTFIFLYRNGDEVTTEKILYKISTYAACVLTDCSETPVVIESSDLNTPNILEDYGKIIVYNKEKLEKSGVMIIKNLEKIPGTSAQAFHSFCDEYNPIVKKAIFLFTMKVDEFPQNKIRYIEKYLRNVWTELGDDKFYPLFTRIVNYVFPIMSK